MIYQVTTNNGIYLDNYEVMNISVYNDKIKTPHQEILIERGFVMLKSVGVFVYYLVNICYNEKHKAFVSEIMYKRLKMPVIIFMRENKLNSILDL